MKLDVKQATLKAVDYLTTLYDQKDISEIDLEEVELSDDDQYWYITLGYNSESTKPGSKLSDSIKRAMLLRDRKYKQFKINRDTGDIVSMKIRVPDNV